MWEIRKTIHKGDYLYALVPDHPRCTKNGYVLYHRIVMENHLHRLLDEDEIVHHKNRNKHDNGIDNLEIMTRFEHARLHGLLKGRDYVQLCCPNCRCVFDRVKNHTHLCSGGKYTACSRRCSGKIKRHMQLNGITAEIAAAIAENVISVYRTFTIPT